ncbi:MAG TPA: DUF4345 domain-containing protein [Stellaceae bacterium]|nr:DUF4345 domain-containing protein [Stellaceae bacterium]
MNERRLLQIVVAIGSLVPICAGTAGIALGSAMVDAGTVPLAADSHYRYLSGLLLGIGIAFATTIPHIERRTTRFRMLTAIVVIGGLGRLISLLARGAPDRLMLFALAMELGVTPGLALWQTRIAGRG